MENTQSVLTFSRNSLTISSVSPCWQAYMSVVHPSESRWWPPRGEDEDAADGRPAPPPTDPAFGVDDFFALLHRLCSVDLTFSCRLGPPALGWGVPRPPMDDSEVASTGSWTERFEEDGLPGETAPEDGSTVTTRISWSPCSLNLTVCFGLVGCCCCSPWRSLARADGLLGGARGAAVATEVMPFRSENCCCRPCC